MCDCVVFSRMRRPISPPCAPPVYKGDCAGVASKARYGKVNSDGQTRPVLAGRRFSRVHVAMAANFNIVVSSIIGGSESRSVVDVPECRWRPSEVALST